MLAHRRSSRSGLSAASWVPSHSRSLAAALTCCLAVTGLAACAMGTPVKVTVISTGSATASPRSQTEASPATLTKKADLSQAPTREQLSEAALALPPSCTEFSADNGQATHKFSSGIYNSTASHQANATVTIRDVTPALLSGRATALVTLACNGGGSYTHSSLAAYSPSLELLGWLEHWGHGTPLPAQTADLVISSVRVEGESVIIGLPEIQLPSDPGDHASGGSATLTETAQWTGSGFEVTSQVFHTPSDDVAVPDQATVQAFYDAAASGDDATAARYASAEVMDQIKHACVGPDDCDPQARPALMFRAIHFPPGGKVDTCSLIGPVGAGSYYLQGTGGEIKATLYDVSDGDAICPVNTMGLTEAVPSAPDNESGYTIWLIVRASSPTEFTVTQLGRNFA